MNYVLVTNNGDPVYTAIRQITIKSMGNKMKMTATQLKKLLAEQDVHLDRVYKVGSGQYKGCFCLKRSFFYTHGRSASELANRISRVLTLDEIEIQVVECRDDWQTWPKDSYFTVYIKLMDKETA